jgi:hypothetical protein
VAPERIQRSRAGITPPEGRHCTQGSAWGLRGCERENSWVLHTNFSALWRTRVLEQGAPLRAAKSSAICCCYIQAKKLDRATMLCTDAPTIGSERGLHGMDIYGRRRLTNACV